MRPNMAVPAVALLVSGAIDLSIVVIGVTVHHQLLIVPLCLTMVLATLSALCFASDITRWRHWHAAATPEPEPAQTPRERAWAKLIDSLNDVQRGTVERHGWFELTSSNGHRWRIGTTSYIGNCFMFSAAGLWSRQYCAHLSPAQDYPLADHLLAQALWIATDEDGFRNVAFPQYR